MSRLDHPERLLGIVGAGLLVLLGVKLVGAMRGGGDDALVERARVTEDSAASAPAIPVHDSLLGRSGELRFRTLTRAEALAVPGFVERYGEGAIRRAAIHRVPLPGRDTVPFSYIVMRAFGEKRGDVLGGYRLGRWPSERWIMARNYWNPDGFVEVTEESARLPLSRHFVLGEFLTKDGQTQWPRYLVIEEMLIDKLELVLADLASRGVQATRVRVLSGFRSPLHNERVSGEGSARGSRHQYGDAADLIVDSNGDGRMDDLNRDGRVDLADTQVILRAVERVEAKHPALVGGTGLYHAVGPSGPFAHIDVRGTSARWLDRQRGPAAKAPAGPGT